jgi:MoaA/NifB/PqqE/SkfB family radical SAM enzyme
MAVEWITFHITDRCQLDCQHCLRDPELKPKDLSIDVVRRALIEGKRVYRATHTAFTGGEPTLHPEFMAIVDVAVELGYTWHMVSNGHNMQWLFEQFREKPSRRAAMTSVTLSLDGADEATHDGIRGKGSFLSVMTAVNQCTARGLPFVLQCAVHAKNQHQVEPLGLLASQLGATRLSFSMTQPTGTYLDKELYLTAAEWRAVMDRVQRLADTLRLPVTHPEGYFHAQPIYTCQAFAQQQLHINVEGELTLCCQHAGVPQEPGSRSDRAGDLREEPLAKAHRRLLTVIHDAQTRKLDRAEAGELDGEWDLFPCNYCLADFGKPHWTEDGVAGPGASRDRWRGAWKKSLPIAR